MQRRVFLKGAAAMAAAGATAKTNVLFVLADQWRFSAFGHAGDPMARTPNIDRFAGQGVRFTNSYAANPLCTPNRSCILTGRYAHQHGMIHNDIMLPPKERAIAEVFSESGYATHYIGKWHMNGDERPGFVVPGWRRRGFQTFEGFNRGHNYPTGAKYFTNEGELLHPDAYEPHYQTDLAIRFMRQCKEKPFYCYLSWGPPHTPYHPPKEWNIHDPAKMKWRANVPEDLRESAEMRQWAAGYYGLGASLDYEFGRILDALRETGLAERTLVIFTSDHGDMLGSHGLYFKSKPEEESLHVPLMMRLPGRIGPERMSDALVSSVDLAPTILALCGLPGLKQASGQDMSGAATGGAAPKADSIYAGGMMKIPEGLPPKPGSREGRADGDEKGPSGISGGEEWRAIVTEENKMVVTADNRVVGLFDRRSDPLEMKNLAGERSKGALERELAARMRRWAVETGDAFPLRTRPAKVSYSDQE